MPNKHFCQGPTCHTKTTNDRFLKSRGVIRGKYAYATMDRTPNQWGWTPMTIVLGYLVISLALSHVSDKLNRSALFDVSHVSF